VLAAAGPGETLERLTSEGSGLFLTRYLTPVPYSFYGHREPPAGSGDLAH
jgi:hypothetical protein